jgi:NAD(P)-dependent dehydrogenase (short-subunit alcohol dehydrogenase family)
MAYGSGMSRVLITGSAGGLGQMAARLLVDAGHHVVLHARDPGRAKEAVTGVPGADDVLIGDLTSVEETRGVAEQANAYGRFDAVIHNAAIGYREYERVQTKDGLAHVFAVNVLAPYLLTALINRPGRLVYLSSGMHRGGDPDLGDLQWAGRTWNGTQAYADSKLFDVVLAFAVARRWPDVRSNALEPGWVATRTGGPGAPDDLAQAHITQAWLAASEHPDATGTGGYFYHQRRRDTHPAAHDRTVQDGLLTACAELTGTPLAAREPEK